MNTKDFCNASIFESLSPKKNNLKDSDADDVAVLLDSIPELDSNFAIIKRIGHGTFSTVYLGRSKHGLSIRGRHHFAIKQIIPTSHPSRVYIELKCLKLMGGKDNIIEASLCLRNINHIALVMPFFPHDSFIDYVGTLTTEEICDYLLNLFIALKKVHSFSIIHRDIKPANFLYSRRYKRYALIDFGLAQEVKKSSHPMQINRSSISSCKVGLSKKFSPSFTETPRLSLCRQVNRKLTTSNIPSPDGFQASAKKRCVASPIFSSASTRISLNAVRRSPRKLPSSLKGSHTKENFPLKAKGKGHKTEVPRDDSPSKHTRLALVFREGKFSAIQNESVKSVLVNSTKTVIPFDPRTTVRKSPRKPFNTLSWKATIPRGLYDSFESLPLTSRNSGLYHPAIQTTPKEFPSFAASLSGYSASGTLHSGSRESSRRSSVLQEVKTRSGQTVLRPSSCGCYGNPKVCFVCLGRRNQHAPRAGTPGFRAPEVLIRHPYQTTAVDMWSVGVILVSLLSGHYPFFRAVDDLSSLAEITTILGTKAIKKAGTKFGKLFTTSKTVPPLDLGLICQTLRKQNKKQPKDTVIKEKGQGNCKGCKQAVGRCVCLASLPRSASSYSLITRNETSSQLGTHSSTSGPNGIDGAAPLAEHSGNATDYPVALYDLLYRLLDPHPESRISAEEAISHPFIVQYSKEVAKL